MTSPLPRECSGQLSYKSVHHQQSLNRTNVYFKSVVYKLFVSLLRIHIPNKDRQYGLFEDLGAGDGTRTRDPQLGRLML